MWRFCFLFTVFRSLFWVFSVGEGIRFVGFLFTFLGVYFFSTLFRV